MSCEADSINHIHSSIQHGKYVFPGRTDYEKYFMGKGIIKTPDELWNRKDLLPEVQHHWHGRGQNGCVFAQAIACNAADRGWRMSVIDKPLSSLQNPDDLLQIDDLIQASIADPCVQIQSLLFPHVTQPAELVGLVKAISTTPSIFIAKEVHYDYLSTIALRTVIGEGRVLSWLMGFGPFEFFPNTRQAPITEIAIRVKTKPDKIFHKLNQDREAAHLADTPIFMNDLVAERLWQATYAKTRNILGGVPDHFSAAKVTFSLPRELWVNR